MNTKHARLLLAAIIMVAAVTDVRAAMRYVNVNSASPASPYASWATAATRIQDAIDVAVDGDEIVVTNGVYQTGGRVVHGAMTNRVAVTKPLTVRSVNGPDVTVIKGYRVPSFVMPPPNGGLGDSAVRCVYLTNGAVLVGFTLTNGATRGCSCQDRELDGGGVWCESASAVISNCVITGNVAYRGGGSYSGTLNDCTLTRNSASIAGGSAYSTLNRCTLTGNFTSWSFGKGGGAYSCTLNNCTLSGNSAKRDGGGAYSSTLNNCALTGNSAGQAGTANLGILRIYEAGQGGGAFGCMLNNCTLTGNSAGQGGGTSGSTLNNCIVYYNTAALGVGPNYYGSTLNYSCTIPLPTDGLGNITAEPQLASMSHLSTGSPCRGAGSASFTNGIDIDGETWANPPSIGCDEHDMESVTEPLTITIQANYINVATGFLVEFQARISGRVSASRWEFDDGTVVSNRPYAFHSWAAAGDYPVALRAFNESHQEGVGATLTVHVAEEIHYVAANSSTPLSPYASWATAARTIQDAVEAAALPGALVLVTNGIYQTGGRAVVYYGAPTNRVAVTKPLTVRSVNGAEVTVIRGYRPPGGLPGNAGVRCVYLTNGAILAGFTLTNGATAYLGDDTGGAGGGAWCESVSAVISNCTFTGNLAYDGGGGVAFGSLKNCTLIGNSSYVGNGGGAYYGTLDNCTLTGNSGGGAYSSTLNNSTLSDNSGSGASFCTLNNCTLTGNSGRGAYEGTLSNCILTGNSGGGASYATLNNCILAGNSAENGGGADGGTLNNCTLTGNSADYGGGASGGTLNNCIVYYNFARQSGANYASSSTFNYSCTTPLPTNGVGNISAEPQLASASHLSAGSPCRSAGNVAYVIGVDIDGEAWANPPSIGCDEFHSGAITGSLTIAIVASFSNVVTGFDMNFTARISGHASFSRWEFGDGIEVTNRPYTVHGWVGPGDYPVVLWVYNESYPAGVSATVTVHVVEQQVYYVAAGGGNPVAPYSSWATAATNIQDAVDAASVVGALVLVSNGVYYAGVAVSKPLTVRSVNGSGVTVIDGGGAVRCVYMSQGATLAGFTLSNGMAADDNDGGGVWCASASDMVSNCVLIGNSGYSGGGAYGGTLYNCSLIDNSARWDGSGGGAHNSTLNNCTLTGNSAYTGGGTMRCTVNNSTLSENSAESYGGGAAYCTLNNCAIVSNWASDWDHETWGGGSAFSTLNNCTVTGNSADVGGGVLDGTLNNCIVYYNWRSNYDFDPRGFETITLNYCSTAPLPLNGTGNITNEPVFIDPDCGNLRLASNSRCINAGNNGHASGRTDLDGRSRIVSGTVDLGAYEFQPGVSGLFIGWMQQYDLPTDGSDDSADPDGDRSTNNQEWRAGTDPNSALSTLRMFPPASGASGVIVSWQSVSSRNYYLERGTNMGVQPPFLLVRSNIVGQDYTTTFMDTNAVGPGPFFYRVGVHEAVDEEE